jgi:hypothetical protein
MTFYEKVMPLEVIRTSYFLISCSPTRRTAEVEVGAKLALVCKLVLKWRMVTDLRHIGSLLWSIFKKRKTTIRLENTWRFKNTTVKTNAARLVLVRTTTFAWVQYKLAYWLKYISLRTCNMFDITKTGLVKFQIALFQYCKRFILWTVFS